MKRLALALGLPLTLLLAALGLATCGSSGSGTPPPKAVTAVPAEPLPALPRSSLAAVLLHRDELALTDDQVKAFQSLDEELTERAKAMTEGPSSGPRPDGGVAQHRGGGGSGSGGGGRLHTMSGRGGGGGAPRGTAGGGFHGSSSGPPKGARTVEERLDDADTRAYLQAEEEILNPEQRDRAREIAEKYREDLYDRRAKTAADKSDD